MPEAGGDTVFANALVQVGLRSRFAPRGRYSWEEDAQRAFNSWLVPRHRSERVLRHGLDPIEARLENRLSRTVALS